VASLLILLAGAVIVIAGIVTVTRRNPIHAAMSMLVALGGVAGLMLAMRSPFLAAMQILLYAGAILVLIVFVIMLLNLREEELGPEPPTRQRALAAVGAIALLFVLAYSLSERGNAQFKMPHQDAELAAQEELTGEPVTGAARVPFGSTKHFGRFLYTDYAVAFELITVLVMGAIAGVIMLARRPDSMFLERTGIADRAGGGH
jgi:NADH-quinone oxidoreductase subunit J